MRLLKVCPRQVSGVWLLVWAGVMVWTQIHLLDTSTTPHQHHNQQRQQQHPPADFSHASCSRCVRHRLRYPLSWKDPRLRRHLQALIQPAPLHHPQPPTIPIRPDHPPWAGYPSYNSTEHYIRLFFQDKRDGVFVDVGAEDGLWLSNTWWLESERGWRGLLVEMDLENYSHLRSSPRASSTINICTTSSLLISREQVLRHKIPPGEGEEERKVQRGQTKLHKYATPTDLYYGEIVNTTCFPIFSLLKAAKISKVDLLTFDLSGGYEQTVDFLEVNKALNYPVRVSMIVYQDSEIGQFYNEKDVRDYFLDYGYSLLPASNLHFILYDASHFAIAVV